MLEKATSSTLVTREVSQLSNLLVKISYYYKMQKKIEKKIKSKILHERKKGISVLGIREINQLPSLLIKPDIIVKWV